VESLCNEYCSRLPKEQRPLFEILTSDSGMAGADCIIGGTVFLKQKQEEGSLKRIKTEYADLLPAELKGKEDQWIGVFYDPAVFLINQSYSRKVGQQQILHWLDLPQLNNARIVMENLSNSDSTKMFLSAMSSRMGQNEFIGYFKKLRPSIKQYAKFPITPVRMAATGDADIAITRRSHVFKYMQNDFPAYILIPQEGTPVNLYGTAIPASSKREREVLQFINWLLHASEARTILITSRSGYLPVLPQGEKGPTVNINTIWLNTFYKDRHSLEKLTEDWIREIRLSGNEEEKN